MTAPCTLQTTNSQFLYWQFAPLETLELSSCPFTDQGLHPLTKLKYLKMLDFTDTDGITEDGMKKHGLSRFY